MLDQPALGRERDLRTVHGALMTLALAAPVLVPGCARWPWLWLAPLACYGAVVAAVPSLRNSVQWLRAGRVSGRPAIEAAVVAAASCAVLLWFDRSAHPSLAGRHLPLEPGAAGGVLAAQAVFAVVNGVCEELVFRGALLDGLQAWYGAPVAVVVTSALFGWGHLQGYPPGPFGAVLAGVYGGALALVRLRSGGLLLPIAAHITADATIYGLLVRAGVA